MKTIAQIGCGYWGPNVLRSIWQRADCKVKWVVDRDPDRRAFVESNFSGCCVVPDIGQVLDDPEVDGVVVVTPAETHFEIVKAALLADKHVLVEKPPALTSIETAEIFDLAKSRGRTLMVDHTFLYHAAVRHLRDLLAAGDVGDTCYIYTQRLNLGQVRNDVSAWWNLAPHDVSIILYLMDNCLPSQVVATGMDYIQEGIDDVVFASLVWPNRVTAQIHVSWLAPTKVRKVTVVGTEKMAVFDDGSDDKIAIYDRGIDRVPKMGLDHEFDEPKNFDLTYRRGNVVMPQIAMVEPLKVLFEHFVECMDNGREPLTGSCHARAVTTVLEAVQQSLDEGGRRIDLPTS